jgi:hypothetical protein
VKRIAAPAPYIPARGSNGVGHWRYYCGQVCERHHVVAMGGEKSRCAEIGI